MNGDDDPLLPHYIDQIETVYLDAVAKGFEKPVVVVLDALYEPCQEILTEVSGPFTVAKLREQARNDELTSMIVSGWKQDSAKHFLRGQSGASKIIDTITATGKFVIFILDGDGPRWFDCPVPSKYPE